MTPLPDYPGYFLDEHGHVWSHRGPRPRRLRPQYAHDPYRRRARYYLRRDGRTVPVYASQLRTD